MSFGHNEYKSWKCLNYFYTDIITKNYVDDSREVNILLLVNMVK